MALSQEQVALFVRSEKDYKISDEKGLQLLVKKSGKKFWRLRYWILDKEKTLSLGSFPEVSLDQARAEQKTALEMLARGIDPSLNRQLKKTIGATANLNSFETVAREWFCIRMANKSLTHQKRTQSILDNHLLPVLGRFDLDQLTSLAVLEALRRIENTGAVETAHRAKNICSLIFCYGIVTSRCERNPAFALKGALKQPKRTHHSAIVEPKELGAFLRALDDSRGCFQVAAALKLAVLFFVVLASYAACVGSTLISKKGLLNLTPLKHIKPTSFQSAVRLWCLCG